MANSISTQLLKAYERSSYCVFTRKGELEITVNKSSPALDALMTEHNIASAAFITAWNPASERLSAAVNGERNAALIADIETVGFHYLPGEGRDPDGEWPAEQSLLVLGIGQGDAANLTRKYGQTAYLFLEKHRPARLILN